MSIIRTRLAVAALCTGFMWSAHAGEGVEATQVQVVVVTDGLVVASATIPGTVRFNIRADEISSFEPVVVNPSAHTTVATGNATFLAVLDGKEVASLQGDQIIVTLVMRP